MRQLGLRITFGMVNTSGPNEFRNIVKAVRLPGTWPRIGAGIAFREELTARDKPDLANRPIDRFRARIKKRGQMVLP